MRTPILRFSPLFRAASLALVVQLSLAPSASANNILGQGEDGSVVGSSLPALTDPANWLPESYYEGTASPLPFMQGNHPTQRIELDDDRKPWSFDTFNGHTSMLSVRGIRTNQRDASGNYRVNLYYDQSPLEKYDTLAASHALKDSQERSERNIIDATAGAALWETDPSNRHNSSQVYCFNDSSGEWEEPSLPVFRQSFVGPEAQIEILGGGGSSGGSSGRTITYQGRPYRVLAIRQSQYQGRTVVSYDFARNIEAELNHGAPEPPSSLRVSGQRAVRTWFIRFPRSNPNDHFDGTWGLVYPFYDTESRRWRAYFYNSLSGVRYEEGGSSDGGNGRHVRLDTGEGNPIQAERFTARMTRVESAQNSGQRPSNGEAQVRRQYEVDLFRYPSGIVSTAIPGQDANKYKYNQYILFPSQAMRQRYKDYYGDGYEQRLPQGSGWVHQFWEQKRVSRGVSWSGHCAGYSAAAVLFKEPPAQKWVQLPTPIQRLRLKARHAGEACWDKLQYETFGEPVSRLSFENRDLKGLAIELAQSVQVSMEHPPRGNADREDPGVKIDWARGATGSRSGTRDSEESESWEDILPHNFHLIMLNYIRERGRAVVMDRHPCDPVWNSPVYAYEFDFEAKENPRRYEVKAQVKYAGYGAGFVAGMRDQDFRGIQERIYPRDGVAPYQGDQIVGSANDSHLRFTLFLDENNRIERSQWTTNAIECQYYERDENGSLVRGNDGGYKLTSRRVPIHPDFIWMPVALAPSRTSQASGRVNRNPKLEENLLFETYPVLNDPERGSYLRDFAN